MVGTCGASSSWTDSMAVDFRRHPGAGRRSSEFELEVAGTTLSGLLAEPAEPADTRCLLVALHGAGMHAGYFDAQSASGLSLLDLASELGYTAWAPDRPGIGASADLEAERLGMFAQADILMDAIDEFAEHRPTGAGVVLVGHSYGLKVAWTMAASSRGRSLLGVDGSGAGIRYAFRWAPRSEQPDGSRTDMQDRSWGPPALYPHGTISRQSLPFHAIPWVQAQDGGHWPSAIMSMAERIAVPIRLTFGEHERLWHTDPASLSEIRELFKMSRRMQIETETGAGHNISLGWAARSYHLKVLAFAESLCVERQLG
jgi:pimeloyl-ACP methyl ester carboxylesterase